MSMKELSRLELITKAIEKRVTQTEVTDALGIGIRQVQRLIKLYRKGGAKGIISKKRGRPGNRRLPDGLKDLAIALIQDHYSDFGPTLAQEKLQEVHKLKISVSSVRTIMVSSGLWAPKRMKKKRIFQYRERRSREGEMMQMDGSPHKWLEERGPSSSLLYTLDDATGKIKEAKLFPSETTWGYMKLMKDHVKTYGRPIALYTDKHGVFRVNQKNALSGDGITQFGRAMKELGIKIIYANTPQAKGRIERMNQTLQDRLVKELRLQKICTLEEANAFLPTFIKDFNRRFAVVPKNPNNAHRELLSEHVLDRIFTIKEERRLTKNLTFQYYNTIYQVQTAREAYTLRNAKVIIYEQENGSIEVFYKGKKLLVKPHYFQDKQMEEVGSKELNALLDELSSQPIVIKKKYKPSKRHPWKRPIKRPSEPVAA